MSEQRRLEPLFQTEETFNEPAIVEGMRALGVPERTIGADIDLLRCVVAGQWEGGQVLRCILTYVHIPTRLIGVVAEDIDLMFLRDLERLGMARVIDGTVSE